MQVDFKPKCCEGDDALFTGHVVMKVPHASERFKVLKQMGLKINQDGSTETLKDELDVIGELCLIAEQFLVESKLIDKDGNAVDKEKIFYNDGDQKWIRLITDISGFVTGLKLGKK